MPQKLMTRAAIAAQLRELCQAKKSGTLYMFENSRPLGQISLREGEIIACWTQKLRGIDALPTLSRIANGSVAFVQGAPPTEMSLPPTADILGAFDRAAAEVSAPFRGDGNSARSPLTARSAEPVSQISRTRFGKNPLSVPLTVASKTIVEQTLKEFIGPVAKILCTDCFRFAPTLDIAVDALAKEIPSPDAAIKFRERVQQRLI